MLAIMVVFMNFLMFLKVSLSTVPPKTLWIAMPFVFSPAKYELIAMRPKTDIISAMNMNTAANATIILIPWRDLSVNSSAYPNSLVPS